MDDLNTRVFRKIGWTYSSYANHPAGVFHWFAPNKSKLEDGFKELPPISSSWEVCAKFLGEFMEQKHYFYEIKYEDDIEFFMWGIFNDSGVPGMEDVFYFNYKTKAEIINHGIAEAACEAFMEVELDG